GAAGLPVGGTAEALLDKLPFVDLHSGLGPVQPSVLDQIRLPRVVLATLVGALLAQAGSASQCAFRNPPSESGTIGASAGGGLFGSFAAADWSLVRLALPYAVISVLLVTVHARHLDVLALGDDEAATLGLNPVRTRLIVLAAASLATATAVAVSGIIGFVGLVVPHVVRRVAGPGHRLLLPLSLLVGGAFLVLADL